MRYIAKESVLNRQLHTKEVDSPVVRINCLDTPGERVVSCVVLPHAVTSSNTRRGITPKGKRDDDVSES